jgi:hypothetical protein
LDDEQEARMRRIAKHQAKHVTHRTRPVKISPHVRDAETLISVMANPESGIKFVLGIAKRAGQRISEVQSVLFDRLKWTADSAKDWLHEHGFITSGKDEGATFWRFRQNDPKRYKEFRTVVPGTRSNPGEYTQEQKTAFVQAHPEKFRGQLWERCRCGREPVNMPSHLCLRCLMAGQDHPRIPGGRVPYHSVEPEENPTPGESISAYDEHLATTMDPEFQAASPAEQAAAMTVQDATENPDWEVKSGSAVVRIWSGDNRIFQSRLYVNNGETATLTTAKHRTLAGAKKWADQVIKSHQKKRNPESAAAELYEEFHGQPPAETLEIVTEKEEHQYLTQIGQLVELKVETVTQLDATFRFHKEAPELCSSEDGRQLYIEGGDQEIDLKALKMDGEKWLKDSMVIGVLYEVTYRTAKGFHKFKTTDYFHKLGEESGVQPFVLYDPRNALLSISGGQYHTKDIGIVN